MAKVIELSAGKLTVVDDELYPALINWKWYYCEMRKGTGYAAHRLKAGRHWINLKMHRFIMGAGERDVVDHIDGDKLNNQRFNLRIVTNRENNQNTTKQVGASGFRGVHQRKRDGKFAASITHFGKTIFLGDFDSAMDAARAYDEAAIQLFGEHAMTNAKMLDRRIKELTKK